MRDPEIRPGQHFRDTQATAFGNKNKTIDLVIRRVFLSTDGKQHAEVHTAVDPSNRRTLSTAILKDRRRFVEVPDTR